MMDYMWLALKLVSVTAFLYFLYDKLVMVYYKYFFYTTQGIHSTGFPIPFINNGMQIMKAFGKVKEIKWTVLEEYWHSSRNYKTLPPLLIEFSGPKGMIIVTDPDLVHELYLNKNKHMEKSTKMQRILRRFIGNSLLFDKSNDLWV
jgi:hypothetical protein